MHKEIIVNISDLETIVAVTEDRLLTEIYLERSVSQRLVGNIYKGRVENVLPGMQAAFVNVGLDKNGFLYVEDVINGKSAACIDEDAEVGEEQVPERINISEVIKRGQDAIVQIVKEPFGTKGPRITSHVTLPGRFVVLMPTVDYIGISRRIEDEGERERLREIANNIKPQGMGVIVRTVGEGLEEEDFRQDIDFLSKLWFDILKKAEKGAAPKLLHRDLDLVQRTLRDLFTDDVDHLYIDSRQVYEKTLEMVEISAPHLKNRISCEEDSNDRGILVKHGIDPNLDLLLAHKVHLNSGGYLVFDQTEAFTSIDVNTGRYVGNTADLEDTVLQTNLEAVTEIARQIRLRNIGGIVVIDFIDMRDDEHQQQLLEFFEQELKKDKIRTNILGMTQLGLIEITRKKERSSLSDILQKNCPYCSGTGKVLTEDTVCIKVKNKIKDFCRYNSSDNILVEVNPAVAAKLVGVNGSGLKELEKNTGRGVYIRGLDNLHIHDFEVKPLMTGQFSDSDRQVVPVNNGEILDLKVVKTADDSCFNGIALFNNYPIEIEGAGELAGKVVTLEITKVYRTLAKAKLLYY